MTYLFFKSSNSLKLSKAHLYTLTKFYMNFLYNIYSTSETQSSLAGQSALNTHNVCFGDKTRHIHGKHSSNKDDHLKSRSQFARQAKNYTNSPQIKRFLARDTQIIIWLKVFFSLCLFLLSLKNHTYRNLRTDISLKSILYFSKL